MKKDIVFVGGNAGYIHCAFALKCLVASLNEYEERAQIIETEVRETTPVQFFERLYLLNPSVVLLSVYLWNLDFFVAVCRLCREMMPNVAIVAGGPQLVPNNPNDPIAKYADVIMFGEGEGEIYNVVDKVLNGLRRENDKPHYVFASPPDLEKVKLPYYLYSQKDIDTRIIYVESSRGCPFSCEYCTSAGSGNMRFFPIDKLKIEFKKLIDKGVLHFKFLDRSFNHGKENSLALLDFFIENYKPGMTLHFEFTPEFPNEQWQKRLTSFPPGTLHLEVGIQTWEVDVAARIKRPLNREATTKTLKFLIEEAKADVHADLIVGLPGEGVKTIASGFNFLVSLNPAELQVGILKLLPGTAMIRHREPYKMRFSPDPPYEVLETSEISFEEMRKMERFAKCWDTLYNRNRFPLASRIFINSGSSPFDEVMELAEFMYAKHGRLYAISPKSVAAAMLTLREKSSILNELKVALETDARNNAIERFPTKEDSVGKKKNSK